MATLAIVAGFVLGSIPFGSLLASRVAGVDLRAVGSGNVGAANAFRSAGPGIGLAVLCLDVAKGAAAVWLARTLGVSEAVVVGAGVAAVVGHVKSPWLRFRGGKGVATACGVFLMLAPTATLAALVVFAAVAWWTKYASLASVVATAFLLTWLFMWQTELAILLGAVFVAAIIVWRHRENIERIRRGVEPRLGDRSQGRA
jgi:acyl phosphate:glycerol-3-phosphate acyltransferase